MSAPLITLRGKICNDVLVQPNLYFLVIGYVSITLFWALIVYLKSATNKTSFIISYNSSLELIEFNPSKNDSFLKRDSFRNVKHSKDKKNRLHFSLKWKGKNVLEYTLWQKQLNRI